LKLREDIRDIPVIFLTALTNTADKVKGFDVGGVDYITKPIEPKEVLARVTTHLQIRDLTHHLQEHAERLQHANTTLKEFAYSVSHDLKAPLRGITRLAQWLVEDYAKRFDDQGREMIELLVDRVHRMDTLIDGILQYSRVGRIANEHGVIPLNTLVRDIIDGLAPPETIRIDIEHELPDVIGDTTRLTQVFQNLISNAINFMDKSEGTIRIGARDEGDQWLFAETRYVLIRRRVQ
jgi:two-component system, LuxR family, sensor kinase FixL